MSSREFGRIVVLILTAIYLFSVCSNTAIIEWKDGDETDHRNGDDEILEVCEISSINFDAHDPNESVIIQRSTSPRTYYNENSITSSTPYTTPICVVNVTAPPGISIILNILETFNNTKPSYLFVETFESCSSTGCYDR